MFLPKLSKVLSFCAASLLLPWNAAFGFKISRLLWSWVKGKNGSLWPAEVFYFYLWSLQVQSVLAGDFYHFQHWKRTKIDPFPFWGEKKNPQHLWHSHRNNSISQTQCFLSEVCESLWHSSGRIMWCPKMAVQAQLLVKSIKITAM